MYRISRFSAVDHRSIRRELARVLEKCGEAPAVLLLEDGQFDTPTILEEMRRLVSTRTLGRLRLPQELRLVVVKDSEAGDAVRSAVWRASVAHSEGFATPEQLRYLNDRVRVAANDEITVAFEPRSSL